MKATKKAKDNKAAIDKLFSPPTEDFIEENEEVDLIGCELQNLVTFMKIADVSTEKSLILENHKKTFTIRQHYRKKKDTAKLVTEFPRFFDVDGLVSEMWFVIIVFYLHCFCR